MCARCQLASLPAGPVLLGAGGCSHSAVSGGVAAAVMASALAAQSREPLATAWLIALRARIAFLSRNRPGFTKTGHSASVPQTPRCSADGSGTGCCRAGDGQELGPAAWYRNADPERDGVNMSSLHFSVLAGVQHISTPSREWSKGKGAAWPCQRDSFRVGWGRGVQEVRSCLGLRALHTGVGLGLQLCSRLNLCAAGAGLS